MQIRTIYTYLVFFILVFTIFAPFLTVASVVEPHAASAGTIPAMVVSDTTSYDDYVIASQNTTVTIQQLSAGESTYQTRWAFGQST